ncbi:hypothetical protein [Dyadobacter chenwenxiniae]|nr:hypothetical protein [Dyadobacter chenwenxiniae]
MEAYGENVLIFNGKEKIMTLGQFGKKECYQKAFMELVQNGRLFS